MRNILAIAGKEIRSNFVTPVAYVVIAGFVLTAGFFFFSLVQQFNAVLYKAAMIPDMHPSLNEWVIMPFYQTLEIILIFLIPVLTMRALAEEKRSGTFELLMTSPLAASEIVVGKFIGIATVVAVMLGLAGVFPLVLVVFADPEVLPVLVGLFGVLLLALSFAALGLAVSSFTRSQTIAGTVSLVFLLLFFVIDAPSSKLGDKAGAVVEYLAPSSHTQSLFQGVLSSTDVIYFLSVISIGLFITNRVLDAERWR